MHTPRTTRRTLPTAIASLGASALLLLATACAGSPDETAEATDPPTTAPARPTPPPSGDPAPEPAPLDELILGTWTSADPGDPFLEFHPDGTFSGSDGCNGVGGGYAVEPGAELIPLDRAPSTLRACLDVDDWLRSVEFVAVDADDHLQAYDGDEEHIGQMHRAE